MNVASSNAGTQTAYTKVAVVLHWTIALLILFNLAIGPFMEGLKMPWKGLAIFLHISSGFSVLALTVARIGWRLMHRPPALLPTKTRWEPRLAHTVHYLLYAGMIVLPLSGWAVISANPPPGVVKGANPAIGRPFPVWGLVKVPPIAPLQQIGAKLEGVPRQKEIHDQIVKVHAVAGFSMMALVGLHILGALKHELFDGQRELRRMYFPVFRRRLS